MRLINTAPSNFILHTTSHNLDDLQITCLHCYLNIAVLAPLSHGEPQTVKAHFATNVLWQQVAEAAAQQCSHQSEDAGKHEAALYGALAGHLQRILPVCHTRADVLWAYTRCWLESQVDRHLAESSGKGDLVSGLQVGKDAVASTQQGCPEEVHKVVLDDVADFWPPSRYCLVQLYSCLYLICMQNWLRTLFSVLTLHYTL